MGLFKSNPCVNYANKFRNAQINQGAEGYHDPMTRNFSHFPRVVFRVAGIGIVVAFLWHVAPMANCFVLLHLATGVKIKFVLICRLNRNVQWIFL